jgi:ATP-dependent protease ClpP protease subunit
MIDLAQANTYMKFLEATGVLAQPVASSVASDSADGVKRYGRDIYFFDTVNARSVLELVGLLRATDAATTPVERKYNIPIRLHVCSYGGGMFEALGVVDVIPTLESEVHSIVTGAACSAATLLSMSCDKRYILPNSFMMVHQVSSFVWGKYSEFQDEMKLLDKLMATATNFYAQRSRLKPDEIAEMLGRDTYIEATEALRYGFVDEILTGGKAKR